MTRRGSIDALAARLTGLYDAREARSIALAAVAELSGLSPSALLTDPEAELAVEGLEEAAARLAAGEPLQYVVGHTEFYGRRFAVRAGVLIPRPETECLVEWAVDTLPQGGSLLDLGTGSGAIALAVADERPDAVITAVDVSTPALSIALHNAERLRLTQVRFLESDLFDAVGGEKFDLIAANLPYVDRRRVRRARTGGARARTAARADRSRRRSP